MHDEEHGSQAAPLLGLESSTMAGQRGVHRGGFTCFRAGMIAALCCAVLVLILGPTTVLQAICGPSGCRVRDRTAPAHKGLDPHAALNSLAQLNRGRHQQTKSIRHAQMQSAARGHKHRIMLEDDDDDDDDEPLDLGACALPDFNDPKTDPKAAADLLQKIENGQVFCCASDGKWKAMSEDCAESWPPPLPPAPPPQAPLPEAPPPEEEHEEPPPEAEHEDRALEIAEKSFEKPEELPPSHPPAAPNSYVPPPPPLQQCHRHRKVKLSSST